MDCEEATLFLRREKEEINQQNYENDLYYFVSSETSAILVFLPGFPL
jgi:hypothetical protein